jgi:WD40 repeat protein
MRPGGGDGINRGPEQGVTKNGTSQSSDSSTANGNHANGHNGTASTEGGHSELYHGVHDREEVTRILLQSLGDLGYSRTVEQLSRESGFALEVPSVAEFRTAVLAGQWELSETLLLGKAAAQVDGGVRIADNNSADLRLRSESDDSLNDNSHRLHANGHRNHNGLRLVADTDTVKLRFLLRQQKYLELLERRKINTALNVLRTELTPLKADTSRLHFLSSLVMCPTAKDLRAQADWDGAEGRSRSQLLSEISASISPSVMIPENRLASMLSRLQDEQIDECRYHNTTVQPSLYTNHECSVEDFPLLPLHKLEQHEDEVWFLEFSHDGSMLATAGKDGLVCVYDTVKWRLKHEFREHNSRAASNSGSNHHSTSFSGRCGVCYVAFSPDDQYLISCCENKEFVVMNVRTGARVADAQHFDCPVTSAAWLPDSQTFVIGSQSSQRPLTLYSLRTSPANPTAREVHEVHSWREPPWDSIQHRDGTARDYSTVCRISDCAIDSTGMILAASTLGNHICVYSLDPAENYRKLDDWPMEDKLTSLNFAHDGDLLVSMNDGRIFTMDVTTGEILSRYEGAIQKEYVVRSSFGGANENFVISGSEGQLEATCIMTRLFSMFGLIDFLADSHVYIWRRPTSVQVAALPAHSPGPVNAVAWHPTNPAIFASAGDDRKVQM